MSETANWRSWSRVTLVGMMSAAALTVAACGSESGGGNEKASSGNQKQSLEKIDVKPTGPAKVKVGTACGDTVPVGPKNKEGEAFQSMSPELQGIYGSYPEEVVTSPWATQKITAKPPWKIGYITIGISNQYQNNVLKQLKEEFALAKAKGLVTGELVTNIPPSLAQSTPESQISAMKQMARQGVNAIIVNPADSVAESATMEQLGEQGVPIILADVPPAPGSKYQTSTWTQNQVEADAGTLGIIGKGNILIVRGVAGNQNDKVLYNQKVQDLKNCPDIKVASVLYGNWDNGTVKQVVSQYLAAHPQPIDGVLQDGGMFAGVVQAFESRGIKVPPVGVEQCYAGDLSWWLKNIDTYKTVAGCINGLQGGYVYFNTALRILANKGPKYNLLSMPAVAIDNTNLKAYAQPGLPLTSDLELPGPKEAWCDDKCLDQYFNEPGPATAK
ncbi:substrate-binding domain-containing protein [Solirubrobacter ginsenosidimutans]|uniref:Substrate-binding domain-containing protein n=1 Tax=Solirubrobacter ginsenosidimutans TaxID=490573 RepID=A0A9X3N1L2_9ACTN|nr:substrate-binding domain-containing protein [Solirubrobacter ginsenosidimutans]MDA0165320.1 substrate-binding domain-containing protein [Solirubrobacter ginsenosidimutans]